MVDNNEMVGFNHVSIDNTSRVDERKLEIATRICEAMFRSGNAPYYNPESTAYYAQRAAETLIKECTIRISESDK